MNAPPKPRDIRNHLEPCIQSVVENCQGYILNPTHQMTRTRRLPLKTCLEIILGRSALDNRNKAIFKRVIFLLTGLYGDRELKSFLKPFIDKLFPLPFESMFKTYRGYRILAFDGTSIQYPYNPRKPECASQSNSCRYSHGLS